MNNKFNVLFLKSDSKYHQYSLNKISWKRYVKSIFLGVIAISLIVVGIFLSSILGSIITILIVSIIAVMGSWGASKDYYGR